MFLHARVCRLGNEEYNFDFGTQVAAMEGKAKELGLGKKLHYLFPIHGAPRHRPSPTTELLKPIATATDRAPRHRQGHGHQRR